MSSVQDWEQFWDNPHSIYVNARHFDVHYRDIANGIVALLPRAGLRVMDYGCGEATHADTVAARCTSLCLCEAAGSARANHKRRFGSVANIVVASPDDVAAMPDGSFDVIVANSVMQYLSPGDSDALLALFRRLLARDGTLIIGDIIPPNVSAIADIDALLRYAARNGFLLAAIGGLIRTLFSDYRRLRKALGLTSYREAAFLAKLAQAGFSGERLAQNLEHHPSRMTFRATPGPNAPAR